MDINVWKTKNSKKRNYAHFDKKVCLRDIWSYINDPQNIKTHGFYPFIHYQLIYKKFNKNNGISPKTRELCYSAHIDRYIFQYYGYKLNQLYNERVVNDGINDSVIAYRDNLKKSNIHFAKKAIDFIRDTKSCFIVVGDFTNFFDNLDHKYLKKMLNLSLTPQKLKLLNFKGLKGSFLGVPLQLTIYGNYLASPVLVQESEALLP